MVATTTRLVWTEGRTRQGLAGRGFYQDSGHNFFWCSIGERYAIDICEDFRQAGSQLPDGAASVVLIGNVLQDVLADRDERRAAIVDPLANHRGLPAWTPESRRVASLLLARFPESGSSSFKDGLVSDGPAYAADVVSFCRFHLRWLG